MTNASLLTADLTLPEALMPFLHNKNGQAIQGTRPPALTATAELGELGLRGCLHIDGDQISADAPSTPSDRAWMAEVLTQLHANPTKVRSWVRKRRGALQTQQEEALSRGLLTKGRGRLFGLFGYDRLQPSLEIRDALVGELMMCDAAKTPRGPALAKFLLTPALKRHLQLDSKETSTLTALAQSATDTPALGPLFTTMDIAIAAGVGVGILGD